MNGLWLQRGCFRPGLAGLFDSKEHLLRATAYPTQSACVMGSLEGKDRNDENPRLQKACVPQETCTVAMGQEKEMKPAANCRAPLKLDCMRDPERSRHKGSCGQLQILPRVQLRNPESFTSSRLILLSEGSLSVSLTQAVNRVRFGF